jgi:hypothetical protein
MAVLFAFPMLGGVLALGLPIVTVSILALLAFEGNLPWSLWHGRRPFFFAVADYGYLACLGHSSFTARLTCS